MKQELKYIELKTSYSDNGPAWIGYVEFSKSGQTIYFNDNPHEYKRLQENNFRQVKRSS